MCVIQCGGCETCQQLEYRSIYVFLRNDFNHIKTERRKLILINNKIRCNVCSEYETQFFIRKVIVYSLVETVKFTYAAEGMWFRGISSNIRSSLDQVRSHVPIVDRAFI